MKGLYVHIPFCIKKCKYCDFNSFSGCLSKADDYLQALFCDMQRYKNTEIDTIFMGGGTPTVLSCEQLSELLKKITEFFQISKNCEFTVEANPKTVTKEKLRVLLEYGVNRLSIGVQSFVDEELLSLGRVHSAKDAISTIELAKKSGFKNISIDIMEGIPHQTRESFEKTLKTAISQKPQHISCYSLILEEGTVLFDEVASGRVSLPPEETEREIYDFATDFLEKNGYKQYEISNFAKDGMVSRHNIKYWDCDEYIGVGLSAHSYLNGTRFSNTDDFDEYLLAEFKPYNMEVLSKNDKMSEFVFLGLRKIDGFSKTEFLNRFSVNIYKVFSKPLNKYIKTGFLIDDGEKIHLSKKAISVSNQIMCEFIL